MSKSITDIPMPPRAILGLAKRQLTDLDKIYQLGCDKVRITRGLGEKSFNILKDYLQQDGYDVTDWKWFE